MAKSALVSGGAKGIGRCLVRRFCELGYRVYVFDIDEAELTHTVQVHLKQYSDAKNLGFSICNLRNVRDIQKHVKEAADFLGGTIDVVVNNGGIASPYWKDGKSMADMDTLEQFQAYVSIDSIGSESDKLTDVKVTWRPISSPPSPSRRLACPTCAMPKPT